MKTIHLSIDDCIASLRWLTYNHCTSIFDARLYGKLMYFHKQYGAKFTLYVFAMSSDFLISEIPKAFADDFEKNKEWLRFGFHGKCGQVQFCEERGFKEAFYLVDETLKSLNAGKTNILRLHYWQATAKQKEWLTKNGVLGLLYPDDDKCFLNNKEMFVESGLKHYRTRVCFEKLESVSEEALHLDKNEIFAFTHERCFDEQSKNLEMAIKIYKQAGYQFV